MDGYTDSTVSRACITQLGDSAVTAAINTVFSIAESHDASFSAVPVATLSSIIQPISFLEPLARFIAETPIDELKLPGELGLSFLAGSVLDSMSRALQLQRIITDDHPSGKKLLEKGKLMFRALAGATWALGPVLTWDIGEV